jgi:hypothetical protein
MKFEVKYLHKKNKGYSKQSAVFFDIESAVFWENHLKQHGAKEIIICPK